MIVLSDTTDLDKDGDGSISSAEIKAAAKAERGAEKNFLVINAKAFESSYMKTQIASKSEYVSYEKLGKDARIRA